MKKFVLACCLLLVVCTADTSSAAIPALGGQSGGSCAGWYCPATTDFDACSRSCDSQGDAARANCASEWGCWDGGFLCPSAAAYTGQQACIRAEGDCEAKCEQFCDGLR